jgi:hypothetical protein
MKLYQNIRHYVYGFYFTLEGLVVGVEFALLLLVIKFKIFFTLLEMSLSGISNLC